MFSADHSTKLAPADPQLLERIKAALRRDLKLDADEPIADDMQLIGGDSDVDSIDVLLIIGTLEKEFGVRIPDRDVSERIFATVASLTAYVQSQQAQNATNAAAAESEDIGEIPLNWRERLPHGPEFRYLTSVTDLRPGERCRGTWRLTGEEPFFKGHFPGNPIVPGVLIVEALAQVAGLASGDGASGGVLAQVAVKFAAPVVPPAEVQLDATVRSATGSLRLCDVRASVAGRDVVEGTLSLNMTEAPKE